MPDFLASQTTDFVGGLQSFKEKRVPMFVWPPLKISKFMFPERKILFPHWVWMWLAPAMLAAFGFFLQNLQLHVGTYYYVHEMTQVTLKQTGSYSSSAQNIHMSFGKTPADVAFGSLEDPITGEMQPALIDISFLDKLAMLFPFFFCLMTVSTDKLYCWTRVMIAFFFLSFFKGLFAWITVVPDSNGWEVCRKRLEPAGEYDINWYAQKHTFWDLLLMYLTHPTSRLCADMMYSGHTYFVTLFAFGLFEVTRAACFRLKPWKRNIIEGLVTLGAIFQQTAEVYFVLKSRFHYTSDVVMAFLMTYLMFTNSTIAAYAGWWCRPDARNREELRKHMAELTQDHVWESNRWIEAFRPSGIISLGCCCGRRSQQYIYSQSDLMDLVATVKESRSAEATTRMTPENKQNFLMDEEIEDWHVALELRFVGREKDFKNLKNKKEEPLLG